VGGRAVADGRRPCPLIAQAGGWVQPGALLRRLFRDLLAGLFHVPAEAFHGVAGGEAQQADQQGRGEQGGGRAAGSFVGVGGARGRPGYRPRRGGRARRGFPRATCLKRGQDSAER
jgi:hypothetical protein